MISADQRLWHTTKSRQRMNHEGEPEPRVVQLAGNEPALLADAGQSAPDGLPHHTHGMAVFFRAG